MKTKFIQGKGKKQEQLYWPDYLTEALRAKIRQFIEQLLEEEIDIMIKAGHYHRSSERTGYRDGEEPPTLGTSLGSSTFSCPRARLFDSEGSRRERQSQILPRYKRRAKAVDDAILGIYLSGTNTRRIKDVALSSSTISRLVGRLKDPI
jgi:transposase-like protein